MPDPQPKISAQAPSTEYAVGRTSGVLWHWSNGQWNKAAEPAAGEKFAVGAKTGTPWHFTGGQWQAYTPPAQHNLGADYAAMGHGTVEDQINKAHLDQALDESIANNPEIHPIRARLNSIGKSLTQSINNLPEDVSTANIPRALSQGVNEIGAGLSNTADYLDRRLPEQIASGVGVPQGVVQKIESLPITGGVPVSAQPFKQAETFFNQNARYAAPERPGLISDVARMGPMIGEAMIPGAGPSLVGATMSGQMGQEAQSFSANPYHELGARLLGFGLGRGLGGQQASNIERLMAREETPFAKQLLQSTLKSSGTLGGIQGVQNLYAKGTYDPNRDTTQGVPESLVMGGILGAGEAALPHLLPKPKGGSDAVQQVGQQAGPEAEHQGGPGQLQGEGDLRQQQATVHEAGAEAGGGSGVSNPAGGTGQEGGSTAPAQQPQEVGPKSFTYKSPTGDNVTVPLDEAHHQAAYQDIANTYGAWMDKVKKLPGDDADSKAFRAKLYKAIGVDQQRAKMDLHAQIDAEKAGGPPVTGAYLPVSEPSGIHAPDNTPEAQQARTELRDATSNLLRNSSTAIDTTQNAGQMYEQGRVQQNASHVLAKPLAELAQRLSPEDQTALQHYLESGGATQLNPRLQKWADEVAKPLMDANEKLYLQANELRGNKGAGLIDEEGIERVPRVAIQSKPTLPEPAGWQKLMRAINMNLRQPGETDATFEHSPIATTDRSMKERTMMAMTGKDGERVVVHVDPKSGAAWSNGPEGKRRFSQVDPVQASKLGYDPDDSVYRNGNKTYSLGHATTKEIEYQTPVQYNKNVVDNLLKEHLRLQDVVRNLTMLNKWKEGGVPVEAWRKGEATLPAGWRQSKLNIAGLGDYFFDPQTARALDHLHRDLELTKNPDDVMRAMGNLNGFLTRSLFISPLAHMLNTSSHAQEARGWKNVDMSGNTEFGQSLFKSTKGILNHEPWVMDWMNAGLPMMSMTGARSEFAKTLSTKLAETASELKPEDPKVLKMAKAIGAPPEAVVKAVYDGSRHILWNYDDTMRLALAQEVQKAHPDWSKPQVVNEVNRHIASYQSIKEMPVALRKIITDPGAVIFGRYHNFVWQNFYRNLKEAMPFTPDRMGPTGEPVSKWEARGHLAALAVQMTLLSAIGKGLARAITGNPNAQVRPFGAMAPPNALMGLAANTQAGSKVLSQMPQELKDVLYQGPKTGYEAAQEAATPTPILRTAAEEYLGRDLYSGQRLSAQERLTRPLKTLWPLGQAMDIGEGRTSLGKVAAGMAGINFKGTPALQALRMAQRDNRGTGEMTPEEQETIQAYSQLHQLDPNLPKDQRQAAADALVKQGVITQKGANRALQQLDETPSQQLAKGVEALKGHDAARQAMLVWRLASPEERQQLAPIMAKALKTTAGDTPNAREQKTLLQAEFQRDMAKAKPAPAKTAPWANDPVVH